mmetsp:Transcript_11932/g.27860  ORF Transcript_11932/g.27860 Transcript_11932/m.27860 type:complete len:159 (-) Transcript_11932:528-1004(-)
METILFLSLTGYSISLVLHKVLYFCSFVVPQHVFRARSFFYSFLIVISRGGGDPTLLICAEYRNKPRIAAHPITTNWFINQREMLRPYAFSSSTLSIPDDNVHEPKLARKEIALRIIHLMFLLEKKVPSFKIRMDVALKIIAQTSFPVTRVGTTSHNA